MPVAEFAGDRSWGCNPAHIFAVESAYGRPRGFKRFVREAHRHGFAVILDVVYNHFGPSDLDLWQFDGRQENDGGGIYFYQDWRRETPWGDTQPDYGRAEVRQFIRDNALIWVEDYHVDGLRMDMTLYIRSVRGAGYAAQWDSQFVHPVREAVITPEDDHRSMQAMAHAVCHRYNHDPFQRVIYSESHDEVANGQARVVEEIAPGDPDNWYAQKRSTLAAALMFTSPGIPMLFQGQEFLEGKWFRDTVPVDWDRQEAFRGIVRLYRDLIALRLNKRGNSAALSGPHVDLIRADGDNNIIGFRRWQTPSEEVVVIANFHRDARENYKLGLPASGDWELLINSDWAGYSEQFDGYPAADLTALNESCDGLPASASIDIGPYSVLIYAQRG